MTPETWRIRYGGGLAPQYGSKEVNPLNVRLGVPLSPNKPDGLICQFIPILLSSNAQEEFTSHMKQHNMSSLARLVVCFSVCSSAGEKIKFVSHHISS